MKRKMDFTEKPYSKCLTCEHRLAKRCDGPRTAPMELTTWCEYMRDMKEANGLTNAYISEKSGVSVKRIEQLMALNNDQDIMRETARRIENAIIGSLNQFPCYQSFEETATANNDMKAIIDNIHTSYAAERNIIREEAQKRIDEMREQIERLRGEIDYLRLENDRKARVIDKFLER